VPFSFQSSLMKIAVVGCGAVGSYYGAMLHRTGQEVHFLLRSDYDVVRRNGVSIQSPAGEFTVWPHCANRPQDIGPSDLVLIALKTTANREFASLLPPLVGAGTALVTLQNGLGNEEQLATLFPGDQVLGGLCFVCLNRIAPGVIRHLDHGLIVLGEHLRQAGPRTHELAQLLRAAGVPCNVTDNLSRAHWEKLVWNIPFNGLGVASAAGIEALTVPNSRLPASCRLGVCLTTDRLLANGAWEKLVRELMLEVIATANALGLGIPETLAGKQIERTRTMGAYKASTLLDFEQGRPLELESLFLEPLRVARQAGVSTPQLLALTEVLQQLDAGRKSTAA
jgi:2-dehydropantoate 2-reductase